MATASPQDDAGEGAGWSDLRSRSAVQRKRWAAQCVLPGVTLPDVDAVAADNLGVTASAFGHTGPLLERWLVVGSQWSAARRLALHCWFMATLLETFDLRYCRLALAPKLQLLCLADLNRLLVHLETTPEYFQDMRADSVRKDLAVLGGRLLAVGSGYAAPGSGIPRRTILAAGPKQAARALRTLWRAGGARGWLELHTHLDNVTEFNAEGWRRTYLNLADALRANPQWRGVCRASWFLDPALRTISPHLYYLADLPLSGGARLFYVTEDRQGTSGALHKSARRRELFAEGRYVPRIYMMAWPRPDLLGWAGQQG
jgi:hypothetical protein